MRGAPGAVGRASGEEGFPIGPRPYAVTRGRTQAPFHLAVELLVVAVDPGLAPRGAHAQREAAESMSPEHRTIHRLCRSPLSVAELASYSGLPLGAARVLISDLVENGLAQADLQQSGADGQPDLRLLERVLGGLRTL